MTTPPSSPRTNVMENIEHVVVLMMENRSLDSLLGWLYERDRPLHNIPALNNASDRAYDGLHGLDLSQYINEAGQPLKQSIEMSLRGVLAAAKWTGGNILNKDAQRQRQALIQQLIAHSSEDPKFFASKSDDELIGMAGAIIYLLGHGDRGVDGLRRMSVEDHRNTLITVLHWGQTAPPSPVRSTAGMEGSSIPSRSPRTRSSPRSTATPARMAGMRWCVSS